MKTTTSRFSIVLVLAIQWISVLFALKFARSAGNIYLDFNAELPLSTEIALNLTQIKYFLPLALIASAIVLSLEFWIEPEPARFISQIIFLGIWFLLIVILFFAIVSPFFGILLKLSS